MRRLEKTALLPGAPWMAQLLRQDTRLDKRGVCLKSAPMCVTSAPSPCLHNLPAPDGPTLSPAPGSYGRIGVELGGRECGELGGGRGHEERPGGFLELPGTCSLRD